MQLFQQEMLSITGRVIAIPNNIKELLTHIHEIAINDLVFEGKVTQLERWFLAFIKKQYTRLTQKEKAIEFILENKG